MDNYDRYKDNCYGKPVNYMWIFLPSQVPNQFRHSPINLSIHDDDQVKQFRHHV